MTTATLIIGCGYLGERVARALLRQGQVVYGTTRSQAGADRLRAVAPGINPVIADVLDPGSLRTLPAVDRALHCVGFDRSAGVPIRRVYVDGFDHVIEALAHKAKTLIYASSTGVYGQDDGDWIDERSTTEPTTESGRACLDAERLLSTFPGRWAIVRFSGLYGPDRVPRRASLLKGEPIAGDPAKWINWIHIDDAADAAIAALDRAKSGETYLASDDRPVRRDEFYSFVADRLGAPLPRFVPLPPGGREDSNKRVANRKIREELDVRWLHADYRSGILDALKSGE